MSETLAKILALVLDGKARISAHGYDELDKDGILFADVFDGVAGAIVVEDYPDASKGPSVLVLQRDNVGCPFISCGVSPTAKQSPPSS